VAGRPVEIWFQDEARVGQQGTLTRIWAKRGTALQQWDELLRGLQNSPAWKGIDGYKPLRLPVGGIRA